MNLANPRNCGSHAQVLVDAKGVHKSSLAAIPKAVEGRTYKIGLAYFAPDPIGEMCRKGLFDGLENLGFVRTKTSKPDWPMPRER